MKNFTIPKTKKIFIGGSSNSSLDVIDLAWNSLKNEFEAPTDFMPDYQINNLLIKLLNDNINNNKNNNENQIGGSKGPIEWGMQMWEERKERLRNEKMAKKAEKDVVEAAPRGSWGWKTKQAKQEGKQAYKNAMEEAKTQQLQVKAQAADAVMKELRKAKEDKKDYVPPVILENAARTEAEALAKTLGATDIVNVDKIVKGVLKPILKEKNIEKKKYEALHTPKNVEVLRALSDIERQNRADDREEERQKREDDREKEKGSPTVPPATPTVPPATPTVPPATPTVPPATPTVPPRGPGPGPSNNPNEETGGDTSTNDNNDIYNWNLHSNMYIKQNNTLVLLGYFKIGTINHSTTSNSKYKSIKKYANQNGKTIEEYNKVLAYNDMTGTHIVNLSEHIGNIKLNPKYETHLKKHGLLDENGDMTKKGKECLDPKTKAIKDTSDCKKYNSSEASEGDLGETKKELEHLITLKEADDDDKVVLTIDADIDLSEDNELKDNKDKVEKVLKDLDKGLRARSKLEGDIATIAKEAADEAALVTISKHIKNIDEKQKKQLHDTYNQGVKDGTDDSYEKIEKKVREQLKKEFDKTVDAKVDKHKEESSSAKKEIEKQKKKLEKEFKKIKEKETTLQKQQDSIKETLGIKGKLLKKLQAKINKLN